MTPEAIRHAYNKWQLAQGKKAKKNWTDLELRASELAAVHSEDVLRAATVFAAAEARMRP